jgi:hypothetical protein
MNDTDPYTMGWIAWIVFFLGLETAALVRKRPGATFSEHVWSWLRVGASNPTGLTWTVGALSALFLLCLVHRRVGGWFTPSDPLPW